MKFYEFSVIFRILRAPEKIFVSPGSNEWFNVVAEAVVL